MGNLSDGMHHVFIEAYDWPSFVLPLVFSFIGVLIAIGIEGSIRKTLSLAYPVPMSFHPQERMAYTEVISANDLADMEDNVDNRTGQNGKQGRYCQSESGAVSGIGSGRPEALPLDYDTTIETCVQSSHGDYGTFCQLNST
jgi:hypothetical protein